MITYAKWSPTSFDTKGLGLEDKQDWFVAPVIQTRDSEVLERCNFECALNELGGESDTVEIHRFGHWGPGWYEIILVHPDKKDILESIEKSLEYYPVLDDMKLSEMEFEEACQTWQNNGLRYRVEMCSRSNIMNCHKTLILNCF